MPYLINYPNVFFGAPIKYVLKKNIRASYWLIIFFLSSSNLLFAEDQPQAFPVSFEGETIFNLHLNLSSKSAKQRATEASKLLSHAVESKTANSQAKTVEIKSQKNRVLIYVRGSYVVSLFKSDAIKEGASNLAEYAENIEAKLRTLVETELERKKWQSVALRFFISIIMLILGIFLIRQLKLAFDRLEEFLVKKRDSIRDVKAFGVPVMRKESFAGLLAFLVGIARWTAYVSSIIVIFFTILSQFDVTRSYVRLLAQALAQDLMQSLQSATLALPGVFLACVILLSLHISIHAFNLMLDGIKKQKVKLRSIPAHRIPIFKTVVPAILLALFLPLAIAAFFQRFDTPAQWLVVGASLIATLGTLPIFATWICGVLILWRNEIKEGDWLSINGKEGEVSSLNTIFLHLVPLDGGIVSIPMLKVFLSPITRFPKEPYQTLDLAFKKSDLLESQTKLLRDELEKLVAGVAIKPEKICGDKVLFKLFIPLSHQDIKSEIIYKIIELANIHNIELMGRD